MIIDRDLLPASVSIASYKFAIKPALCVCIFMMCFLLTACDHSRKESQNQKQAQLKSQATNASIAETIVLPTASSGLLPVNFNRYSLIAIGGGDSCVVGAEVDDDGTNQRPFVFVVNGKGGTIWKKALGLPVNSYQARATHCEEIDDAIFILLQSDTQPQQTLSQTLLSVSKLDVHTGATQALATIAVPKLSGAYSSWVDEGADHFQWKNDALVINGNYFLLSNKDQHLKFQVQLGLDLKAKKASGNSK